PRARNQPSVEPRDPPTRGRGPRARRGPAQPNGGFRGAVLRLAGPSRGPRVPALLRLPLLPDAGGWIARRPGAVRGAHGHGGPDRAGIGRGGRPLLRREAG